MNHEANRSTQAPHLGSGFLRSARVLFVLAAIFASVVVSPKQVESQVVQGEFNCIVGSVPAGLFDPFYVKGCEVGEFWVLAGEPVAPEAIQAAGDFVAAIFKHNPAVDAQLATTEVRLGIIGRNQRTTEMPEYRDLYEAFPDIDWDNRARGLGATVARPLVSNGEENTLCLPEDLWAGEDIILHEFAHVLDQFVYREIDATFQASLEQAFASAVASGIWNSTYAETNKEEYWAEAVQSYFVRNLTAEPPNGVHGRIDTRVELAEADPLIFNLIDSKLGGLILPGTCHPTDSSPPEVSFPEPNVFIDQGSPQTVSGTITDAESGVGFVQVIGIDIGAAGAAGVPEGELSLWGTNGWETRQASDIFFLPAEVNGDTWSFTWDPVFGGTGSYSLGIRAFDNAGNKWPANKDWQALVVISDVTKPSIIVDDPVIVGDTVTWSGSASDDTVIRRTRMIIRHIESNEYWNGEGWVDKNQALADLADPNRPNITLLPEQSAPLSPNVDWSYSLTTDRVGRFQTLHWAQNGAYTWTDFNPTVRIVTLE